MPQTPRAEVKRPRPAESAAQPTAHFAVGLVARRSYSYLARNDILKRPYASFYICTMEKRPALPIGFLNVQSLVARGHTLLTQSSTL